MALESSGSNIIRVLVGGISACVIVYFVLFREYETLTALQVAYAVLIILLGMLPATVTVLNKREANLIPLMPLHGIFYAFTFGFSALSNNTDWLAVDGDVISNALGLTVVGLVCLYFGYYATRGLLDNLKPIRTRPLPTNQQIRVAWILFGASLAFYFFPYLRSIPSIEQLSVPLGYLSLGILALLAFGRQLSYINLIFFVIASGFTLLLKVVSGSLAPAVLYLVFIGIIYWNIKRRVPIYLLIFAVLIPILLNPIKLVYRDRVWHGDETSADVYQRAILIGNVVLDHYDSDIIKSIGEDDSTINRLAHISTFAHVISLTPTVVPFWQGDSYYTLWTSFVPRILWPNKPEATIGQDFGHRYFLISQDNLHTSINLPWLIEFYANFGGIGVCFGMFLVGFLFRFLVQKLTVPVIAPAEHVLGIAVMFGLFYAESNFSLMIGGVLSTYISLYVLLYLLTRGLPNSRALSVEGR